MALKFGRLTLIPIGILASLPSCGEKSAENEGFIPKLSELTKEDVLSEAENAGNALWEKVVAALGIVDIDRSSQDKVLASLAVPSTKITDATQAATWAAVKAGKVVADAGSQKCDSIQAFVDLAPGTNFGIAGNGAFKIGADGKTPTKLLDGTPLAALAGTATAKVYLMKYKLNGDTDSRNAIVTIPDMTGAQLGGVDAMAQAALTVAPDGTSNHGYPVVFYAHAGATGLAYEEVAQTFGDMQASHIIVAPVFPGEPFCVTYDTDATTGSKIPTCTGTNIGAAAVGTSDPYTNDVVDLLGAYECVKAKASAADIPVLDAAGTPTGTLPALDSKFAKISVEVAATADGYATAFGTTTANGIKALKVKGMSSYPVSYVAGLGRGAAVANLAVARGGAINSVLFSSETDEATVAAQTALNTAGVTPGMFSCSIAGSPQATFTAGLNKIILNYWVTGTSNFLDSTKQDALARVPGFAVIKAKIDGIKAAGGTDDEQADAIAAYVESIDSTYHMGLIHVGLQNWGKVMRANTKLFEAGAKQAGGDADGAAAASASATATTAAAQGSGLILHGTSDIVASVTNSQLFSGIAVQMSTALEAASPRKVGGVNWLALGIAPTDDFPVDGVADVGHVSNASFLKGKAIDAATSKMTSDSSYTIDDYKDKTPVEVIAKWLTSCEASVSSAAN
jgi:hypothetical protein